MSKSVQKSTDKRDCAINLRYAITAMAIRYGASCSKMRDAAMDGKWEEYRRLDRASERQFVAIGRLADALKRLAIS